MVEGFLGYLGTRDQVVGEVQLLAVVCAKTLKISRAFGVERRQRHFLLAVSVIWTHKADVEVIELRQPHEPLAIIL